MSFLSEYSYEYIEFPIRPVKSLNPEKHHQIPEGNWKSTKFGSDAEKGESTDEEIREFIKRATRDLRHSTYTRDYCEHLDPELKTRVPVPRERDPCKLLKLRLEQASSSEEDHAPPPTGLALKDTEMMKQAKEIYERDLDSPVMKPLPTHPRILSYISHHNMHTGLSEYQESIGRLAYEMVRDDQIKPCQLATGGKPLWDRPPKGRQPMIDVAPYDGERELS